MSEHSIERPFIFPVPGISPSHFRNEATAVIIPLKQPAELRMFSLMRNWGYRVAEREAAAIIARVFRPLKGLG